MSTATLQKPRAEPEERHDPVNDMLAMVEANCRHMIALGYGAQLEARLARLFPKEVASSRASGTTPAAGKTRTQRIIADGETALHLSHGMEVLRRHRDRLGAANDFGRASVATCVAVLMERLMGPATAPTEGGQG